MKQTAVRSRIPAVLVCILLLALLATNGAVAAEAEGFKAFRAAAESGSPAAMYGLGECYARGKGVRQDIAEAAKWYREAAERGHTDAMVWLAEACLVGAIVTQDDAEAGRWFRKAADAGNARAMLKLGEWYLRGEIVPKDDLGAGRQPDFPEAVKWLRKAGEAGNVEAMLHLTTLYAAGNEVPADMPESVAWCRRAAEAGSPKAMSVVASCYLLGEGVPRDFGEALKWSRKAADAGDIEAMCTLGICYGAGRGVPQNRVLAYVWLSLAAARGHAKAAGWRDEAAGELTAQEIAAAQRLAADLDSKLQADAKRGATEQGVSRAADTAVPVSTGTGFFVTADGYLVTAAHVARAGRAIEVRTRSGTGTAVCVHVDEANDMALLKTSGTHTPLPVVPSRAVRLGSDVFTVGFPNPSIQGVAPKLTKGSVSALTGLQDDPRLFQISVPLQPGNSGGPLVNGVGQVIGLVVAAVDERAALAVTGRLPQTVNYAVKSAYLLPLLESIPAPSSPTSLAPTTTFDAAAERATAAACLILVYER